jgi:hypothetical protein
MNESSYSYDTYGGVAVVGRSAKKPDPAREYVGGGANWVAPGQLSSLPSQCDELSRRLGPRVWHAMLTDPAVSSGYRGLQLSSLSGPLRLRCAVKMPAWARGGDGKSDNPDQQLSPTQKKGLEVLRYAERLVGRMDNFRETSRQLLDCMGFGVKLAEITTVRMDHGPDKGKEVWGSFKVKPNWAWRFVVDSFLDVKGLLTWNPAAGGYEFIDSRSGKFVWQSWMPDDGDPRGTNILRAAYHAWNLKVQMWPLFYQHMVRFGSPGLDMELAPNDQDYRDDFDANGVSIASAVQLSPAAYATKSMQLFRGGGTIVRPWGSKLSVFEPKSQGEAFHMAMGLFDDQILLGLTYQAKSSGKAKKEDGVDGDMRGLLVQEARDGNAATIRRAIKWNIALNFGDDVADELTPVADYGSTEAQDRAPLWTAVASLYTAGFLTPSMKDEICAAVGLPVADSVEDAKVEAMRAQQAIEVAGHAAGTAKAVPIGTPGRTTPADKVKPKPGSEKGVKP